MAARRLVRCLVVLGVASLAGCASTTVVKDPGPDDCGFRFYRSKPYLLVQPSTAENPNIYTITLTHMADFSEEYSAHINPGLGTNNTQLTFNEAGVLTATTVNVDSQVDELISSLATLVGTTPNLFRSAPQTGGGGERSLRDVSLPVEAYNVPIGFYEAVLSPGPDGRKRLYGWRYIGFMPFAPCPLESGGGACTNCVDGDIYGLVTIGSAMYFRKLPDLARPERIRVERTASQLPEHRRVDQVPQERKVEKKNSVQPPGGPLVVPKGAQPE